MYDVTMTPNHGNVQTPSNLTGTYHGVSAQDCFQRNRIMKNRGRVCYNMLCECINPTTQEQYNQIQQFCSHHGTSGFYQNGSWWVDYR